MLLQCDAAQIEQVVKPLVSDAQTTLVVIGAINFGALILLIMLFRGAVESRLEAIQKKLDGAK